MQIARFTVAYWCVLMAALLPLGCAWLAKSPGFGKPRKQGGFDNHNLLMQDHPVLMQRLNDAMSAFYAATVELGVADKVTTFTASDFGRTLSSNADGSDHGWGSHHFVMGGAVNGGRFYGTAPHVSIQTDDQVGQGRLLPSTSVDEFAATLARWFGCATGELPGILPNVGNFSNTNLGFV